MVWHKSVLSKACLLAALTPTAIVPAWCQQSSATKPSVTDLVSNLHSKDWTRRSDAVNQINTNQAVLRSRKLQAALIELLDCENRNAEPCVIANSGDEQGGEPNEGFAEYFAWLRDIVASFADWNDPRQACILVNAGSRDYPSSPTKAAARARAAMPCILKRAKSDEAINRAIAAPMLLEALARGKGTLDSKTVQSAKQIMSNNLRDSDAGVRAAMVVALGNYGGADAIPMLQEIARSDPAFDKADDGGQWFPIRDSAAKAVIEIQKRESQR